MSKEKDHSRYYLDATEDTYQPSLDTNSYYSSDGELCESDKDGDDAYSHHSVRTDRYPNTFVPSGLRKNFGILLTLFASLCFSVIVLIVKILVGPDYNFSSYSVSFWRCVGVAAPAIPLMLYIETRRKYNEKSVFTNVWPLSFSKDDSKKWWTIFGLFCRGVLGGSSVILRYFALEYLTIGDTSVITYATPVIVTVMAHFFLGEKCGVVPVITALTTFAGVLIMTRPPFLTGEAEFDTNNLIGIGLALGSLVCASLSVVLTRFLTRNVHFSLMMCVFGSIGLLLSLGLTQIFQDFSVPTEVDEIVFILTLMLLSFIAQTSVIHALKFEQAGVVSLIRSMDVLFGFALQFVFLGVAPDWLSVAGGAIVLSCVVITGFRKVVSTLREESKLRRGFKWLLR